MVEPSTTANSIQPSALILYTQIDAMYRYSIDPQLDVTNRYTPSVLILYFQFLTLFGVSATIHVPVRNLDSHRQGIDSLHPVSSQLWCSSGNLIAEEDTDLLKGETISLWEKLPDDASVNQRREDENDGWV
jgi:hypothetical protein